MAQYLKKMLEQINSQNMLLPDWVQIWMNWLIVVFLGSIFFIRSHREARWTLAVMLFTVPTVLLIFALFTNIHLFGLSHILLWLPLSVYFVVQWRNPENVKYRSFNTFSVCACMLLSTITISLIFDFRDIFLVIGGYK